MHNDLGNHAKKEVLAKTPSEAETGPVMTVLHDLETVTVELDVAVEEHLLECLQGNSVLAIVLALVGLLLEGEVVLDGTARVLCLFVLAGSQSRNDNPEGGQDGDAREDGEEDTSLDATSDLPGEPKGHTSNGNDQRNKGEAVATGRVGR